MKVTIILNGKRRDVEQALAELKSNIDYDGINVKVKEEKPCPSGPSGGKRGKA